MSAHLVVVQVIVAKDGVTDLSDLKVDNKSNEDNLQAHILNEQCVCACIYTQYTVADNAISGVAVN